MDEAARQYNLVVTNPKQMDVASSEGKVSLQQAVVISMQFHRNACAVIDSRCAGANAALSMLEQARKGATA